MAIPHWTHCSQHYSGAVPLGQPLLSPQRPPPITPRWPLTSSPHRVEDGRPAVRMGCLPPRRHRGASASQGRIVPPRRRLRRRRLSSAVRVLLRCTRGRYTHFQPLFCGLEATRLCGQEPRRACARETSTTMYKKKFTELGGRFSFRIEGPRPCLSALRKKQFALSCSLSL